MHLPYPFAAKTGFATARSASALWVVVVMASLGLITTEGVHHVHRRSHRS